MKPRPFAPRPSSPRVPHRYADAGPAWAFWWRRWTGRTAATRRTSRGAGGLEAARALIAKDFANHLPQLSPRDLRLYLSLMSASCTRTLLRLRFDLFDLWCRRLGETVALTRLRSFDDCLASGH